MHMRGRLIATVLFPALNEVFLDNFILIRLSEKSIPASHVRAAFKRFYSMNVAQPFIGKK